MSLSDRTNEMIPMSMRNDALYIDIDQDSSIHHEPWVWLSPDSLDEFALQLTLEEAGLLHDRLSLILGRHAPDSKEIAA